jgi:hypothetical protein
MFRKECSECDQQLLKSQSLASDLETSKDKITALKEDGGIV